MQLPELDPYDETRLLPAYQAWHMPVSILTFANDGVYLGSIFGCTMEKLNKNPVTQSLIGVDLDSLSLSNLGPLTDCRPSMPTPPNHLPSLLLEDTPRTPHRTSNFRSDHRGGANFLRADGSVQFVPETIDVFVYRAMSSIQGGETVADPNAGQ